MKEMGREHKSVFSDIISSPKNLSHNKPVLVLVPTPLPAYILNRLTQNSKFNNW